MLADKARIKIPLLISKRNDTCPYSQLKIGLLVLLGVLDESSNPTNPNNTTPIKSKKEIAAFKITININLNRFFLSRRLSEIFKFLLSELSRILIGLT
jgi:hypothetical protein